MNQELCLNPLSRVNCILIKMTHIILKMKKSQSPKSGQLHSNTFLSPLEKSLVMTSLNPLSRVNCILIVLAKSVCPWVTTHVSIP